MAKKNIQQNEHVQLSLEDLIAELDKNLGEPVKWNVQDDDIGGELLSILSKGLYSSPLDCIREYVQNAVDAQSKEVTIRVTGNSVTISDNGSGMDLAQVLEARKFGISPKSLSIHVGFRGIGIYSGFDICNKLVLTTKKKTEKYAYVLEFEFGLMKILLDKERQEATPNKLRTPLTELLSQYSQLRKEPEDNDEHYTVVQLEELSSNHIDQLADRTKLKNYLLKNLPIDFAQDFPHKEKISSALKRNVPGYNAVIVHLDSDTEKRDTIVRPNIPNLDEPSMNFIYTGSGVHRKPVAYYWCALHLGGNRIPETFTDYRGFIYKVKGFTIGDNIKLSKYFKKGNGALYLWYTGEIFILDQNVIPNAARDDFEPGQSKLQLDVAIQDELKIIEDQASKYQQQTRADKVVMQNKEELNDLQNRINNAHYDQFDEYSKLTTILKNLRDQRKKVTDQNLLNDLINHTEKLIKIVKKAIDQPKEPSNRQIIDMPPVPSIQTSIEEDVESVDVEKVSVNDPISIKNEQSTIDAAPDSASQTKTLVSVFELTGWNITSEIGKFIEIIDKSLSDILATDQEIYYKFLEDLERKISNEEY